MPVLLATYGTLMSGQRNGLDPKVRGRMRNGRPCRIAGRLYEVREPGPDGPDLVYPALVCGAEDDVGIVQGEVFEIGADEPEAAFVLAATDRYEECVPDDPAASIYLRQRRPILVAGVTLDAWVYLYNRPTDGLRPIANGCWT